MATITGASVMEIIIAIALLCWANEQAKTARIRKKLQKQLKKSETNSRQKRIAR